MKRKLVFFTLTATLIFFFAKIANAQLKQETCAIRCLVADSATRIPLEFVTVNLVDSNNVLIKVTLTDKNGFFNFSGIASGKYSITLTTIGYNPKTIFKETDSVQLNRTQDTIYITTQAKELKMVTVIGTRPLISQGIDRITYNVQSDPENKVNNVLEMMKKVPYLSVDAEENILLKGNTSYRIFIDGRPSSMIERNAKEVLRSIPASTIQRIEVITSPSSKYDAEGLAGIINIVTNKRRNNGYTGNINFNYRFPAGGPGTGVSFSAKQGKFGFTGYAGANLNKTPQVHYDLSQKFTNMLLFQNGLKETDSKSTYLGAEFSYEADSLNLVSGQFNINGSRNNGTDIQNSVLNNQTSLIESYAAKNVTSGNGSGSDASVNYQLGFKADKKRLLTVSYRYMKYKTDGNNDILLSDKVNYVLPDYSQKNKGAFFENTVQIDYVRPIGKFNLENGLKAILRNNKSDFEYLSYNATTGLFEKDNNRSDLFTNTQNIFGAYTNSQFSVKDWNFQIGVRIEQTIVDAKFISTSTTATQNYFNVIPSIAIQKPLKNGSGINFGFNQRIKRPGINRLNPFVDRSNPNFESSGNPNLQSVLNNDIQLGYSRSKKATINVGLGYSFSNNIDLKVSSYDTATKITRITYDNSSKASRLGIDFNFNYPLTNKWSLTINGNIAYFFISGFTGTYFQKNNLFTYFLDVSTGYRFEHNWRANGNLNSISRSPTGLQGVSNALVNSSFSISKTNKENLSFSAFLNNPFTKFRYSIEDITGSDFLQQNSFQQYFRAAGISVNYKFGNLKKSIQKNKREIRNDDLAN